MSGFGPGDRIATARVLDGDGPPPSHDLEQERRIAAYELVEENAFRLEGEGAFEGPYDATLERVGGVATLTLEGAPARRVALALEGAELDELVAAYLDFCVAYREAVLRLAPSRIEQLDAERRRTHDEGSELLRAALAGRARCDGATARRLFTLLCSVAPDAERR